MHNLLVDNPSFEDDLKQFLATHLMKKLQKEKTDHLFLSHFSSKEVLAIKCFLEFLREKGFNIPLLFLKRVFRWESLTENFPETERIWSQIRTRMALISPSACPELMKMVEFFSSSNRDLLDEQTQTNEEDDRFCKEIFREEKWDRLFRDSLEWFHRGSLLQEQLTQNEELKRQIKLLANEDRKFDANIKWKLLSQHEREI